MFKVTTKYKTNHNGTGQILATGGGRQRTVQYNDAKSVDWNHGNAAGTLIKAVGGFSASDTFTHEVMDDGRHRFTAAAYN